MPQHNTMMEQNSTETIKIRDLYFVPLFTEADIRARVQALGTALTEQFGDKNPLFVSILSGAFVFASDLIRRFEGDCEVSFVKLASYAGTQSTGAVQVVMGLEKDLTGRHVIVVEDIVDTGRTLHHFIELLQDKSPASITTVTLLRKPDAVVFPITLDHIGFDITDRFVVGYGLDYDGLGRNLPGVYQLKS